MEKKELKLNYRNTLFIGCAFFSILMLWQVYNQYAPLFLGQLLTFENENEELYIIGIIMAADNFFALFMLPIFGNLSDRTKTKFGKRMPYIVVGMLLAALLFPLIAVMFNQNSLVGVIVMMGVILIVMNTYRSPAVALMPDVTPKPLRSKANGIINLTGYIGAIIAGALAMVFTVEKGQALNSFIIASFFMLLAMVLLVLTIKENQLLAQTREDMKLGEELSQSLEKVEEGRPISKSDKRNFVILLLSVFFWFVSFNAVETFLSTYCQKVLGNSGIGGLVTIIMTISALLTFLPSGILANRIGRKKSILIGLVSIISGFIVIIFLTLAIGDNGLHGLVNTLVMILSIVLCGIGWALINVNSYPMMVEMSTKSNIGRYTGYYYTSSMVAQTFTPIAVGFIMAFVDGGLKLLFYYSLIMMIIALVVFVQFQENKNAVKQIKKGLSSFDVDD